MTRGLFLGAAALLAGCATVPPAPPGALEDQAARYACTDGTAFTVRFDRWSDVATLTFERHDRYDPDGPAQDGDFRVALSGQRVASGIWYAGGGWSLRGKGEAATLTRPDGRASDCRAGAEPIMSPVLQRPDTI